MTDLARLRADYRRFHHLHLATGDIDPVYPVLDDIAAQLGLDTEHRVRLVFTHVAYYHLGSALRAWEVSGGDFAAMPAPAKTGTERRAHRNPPNLRAHLDALAAIAEAEGGLAPWLRRAATGHNPKPAWCAVTDQCLLTVRGNGRWAAYKTAEMLADVAHLPLAAPDMGHAHSTGPRHGLALIYPHLAALTDNKPPTIALLDHVSAALATNLGSPIEKVETSLCDFHTMTRGGYYLGHDIDLMLAQVHQVPSELTPAAMAARAATLPAAYLGEHNDWDGVDKPRKRAYRDTGTILERP